MTGPGQLSIDEPGPPEAVDIGTMPLPGQQAATVAAADGQTYQIGLAQVPDGVANVVIRLTNGTGSNRFEVGRPGA